MYGIPEEAWSQREYDIDVQCRFSSAVLLSRPGCLAHQVVGKSDLASLFVSTVLLKKK